MPDFMQRLNDALAQLDAAGDDPERKTAALANARKRLIVDAGAAVPDPDAAFMVAVRSAAQAETEAKARDVLRSTEPGAPREVRRSFAVDTAPDRLWLVRDWLPDYRVGLFTGEGGRGKSRIAIQLAACIAAGDYDWLPGGGPKMTITNPENAVYWTSEDETDEAHRRLDAIRSETQAHKLNGEIGDRLHVIDGASGGPLWAPAASGSRHTSTMGELTAAGAWLREYAEHHRPRLLVIDPLAAAFACNENDRGLVRAFMSDWDRWARETECAVMFIAHPPKSDTEYSGSTDWRAAARWLWTFGLQNLPSDGDGPKLARNTKQKTAPRLDNGKANYARPGAGEGAQCWIERTGLGKWHVPANASSAPAGEFAPGVA